MINRREFLGITAGAGAALALTPELLRALQQSGGKLMQRAIPSSGEMLPVISFGPRSLGGAAMSSQPADVAAIKEVLKTLLDNGGKVVDVLHGGPAGEQGARTAADELGIQNKFFWTTPLSVIVPVLPGSPAAAEGRPRRRESGDGGEVREVQGAQDRPGHGGGRRRRADVPRRPEGDEEGGARPVHRRASPRLPAGPARRPRSATLESIMRNEPIDFVGTDYSVGDRRVEETILPLALERKIGFMAYFPFDRGRLFKRASSTPLPEWAAEFDAKTWAQFFLKYVLSHPAVIVARTGTTKAAHMLDNIGGGIGRLPNEAMRKRMAELVDSLPADTAPGHRCRRQGTVELSAAILDRYVGEYTTPAGAIVTFRREGTTLFVKLPGSNPEVPLGARSEIRFGDPQARVFEFHVDGQGKVTGALMEQGPQPLKLRPRKSG